MYIYVLVRCSKRLSFNTLISNFHDFPHKEQMNGYIFSKSTSLRFVQPKPPPMSGIVGFALAASKNIPSPPAWHILILTYVPAHGRLFCDGGAITLLT